MSNSPTPPAQDGERELLREVWGYLNRDYEEGEGNPWFYEESAIELIKMVRSPQSAELAALHAQVDGLRKLLKLARTAINEEVQAGGLEHPTIAAHARVLRKLDAALAPPQPVAKETKP